MSKLTEQQLADLTDEEREAIEADDGAGDAAPTDPSEVERSRATPPGSTEPPPAEKADGDGAPGRDDGDPEPGGEGGGGGEAAPPAAAPPAAEPAKTAPPAATPLLSAEAPADADAKLKEIGEKKDALAEKLDNGDITTKEYQVALDALNGEKATIEQARFKASLAAEMENNRSKDRWLNQVNGFLAEHPEYRQHETRWNALDAEIKRLARDTEFMKGKPDGNAVLAEAHKNLSAAFGVKPADPPPGGDGKPPAQSTTPAVQRQPLPPTLGKVPAAEQSETANQEYAALDRLQETDPIGYEDRLSRMSKDQLDQYLARA